MLNQAAVRLALTAWMMIAAWPGVAGELPKDRAKLIFDREWTAYSRTAIIITGDIQLTRSAITFANQVMFELRYLYDVVPPAVVWDFREVSQFSLFEILNPEPRALLDVDHLCGNPAYSDFVPLPRYLALGVIHQSDEDRLIMMAFATDKPPPDITRWKRGEYCGGYSYFTSTTDPPRHEDGTARYYRGLQEMFLYGKYK
jgi:hypothetical protein